MKCEHCNDEFESIKDIIKHLRKDNDRLNKRYIKLETDIEKSWKELKEIESTMCNTEALIDSYKSRTKLD